VWGELEAGRKVSAKELVLKLYQKAEKGDAAAIREVLDRVFGRPSQEHHISGAEGEPMRMEVIIRDVSK